MVAARQQPVMTWESWPSRLATFLCGIADPWNNVVVAHRSGSYRAPVVPLSQTILMNSFAPTPSHGAFDIRMAVGGP